MPVIPELLHSHLQLVWVLIFVYSSSFNAVVLGYKRAQMTDFSVAWFVSGLVGM